MVYISSFLGPLKITVEDGLYWDLKYTAVPSIQTPKFDIAMLNGDTVLQTEITKETSQNSGLSSFSEQKFMTVFK